MSKAPKPRWINGRLDPDWLSNAGLRFIRPWLMNRLSGRDQYQPIDPRVGEDPDAFVVGLLREVGADHPAYEVIARAVLQLLDEARKAAPKAPEYFTGLLRICQQIRLSQASTWFTKELEELARDVGRRNRREELWGGYEIAKEICYAALVQSPGFVGAASRRSWERLLNEPRYTTIALMGLSRTLPDQAGHLGKWWTACNVDERERELEQKLISALEDEGEERVRTVLKEHAPSLPNDLKRAIDLWLRRLGCREIFVPLRASPRALSGAIDGAGQRREFVLAEQGHAAE